MRQALIIVGATSPVPIVSANAEAVACLVQADTANTAPVYLGNNKVIAAGIALAPGQAQPIYLAAGEDLWGISPVAGQLLRVLSSPSPSEFGTWGIPAPLGPAIVKQLSAVVVTAETTIWTPAAGKRFRLLGYAITQGVVTGAVALKDGTGGTTILTVPPNTLGAAFPSPAMGNGILSAAANNLLTATGVATETISGYVFGTEE